MPSEIPKEQELVKILKASPLFQNILDVADRVPLKNWYIAGGAVTQTVWNWRMGFEPLHGLKDVDLVYFDDHQSDDDQALSQLQVQDLFSEITIPVDVKNEALVHRWYAKKFGYEIPPYNSTEDGIQTWLPAFAVGVRPMRDDFIVFAPFGLDDLFGMIIRPNKKQITEEIYKEMVQKFTARWPRAEVISWS